MSTGLANGTRLTVLRMHSDALECDIINGSHQGHIAVIPRITLNSSQSEFPFVLKILKFPVILAAAMTINKSQGQILDAVGVYLKDPVFAHGQLYVALSRASSLCKIRIIGTKRVGSKSVFTPNIVYREVLK